MSRQDCPNCGRTHDVSVYVSGQRVLCRCGIRFDVRRSEVSGEAPSPGSGVSPEPGGEERAQSGVAPPATTAPEAFSSEATVVRGSRAGPESEVESEGEGEQGQGTSISLAKVELPGFELLRVLGRGGMGEVWLARQRSLGRTVAVKLLPPRLAKDPEFVTRFEKEATALAALSHPNIIQIIDRGVAGAHYYFVMEYVEGRSLREVMGMSRLPPPQGLRILLQVARAIECAHDKGIIHRDLKPENILLDARGHVKVADFGLAGIRQPDSRLNLTATAVAMGTLNYMAPEQRRDAKSVDGRADLFSLGVMLYEVLTGELPVGRFRLPSERVPELDARVDAVVARLLENEPEARYATASEVCAALEAVVTPGSYPALASGEQAEASPRSRPRTARSAVQRLRSGWRSVRAGLSVVGGLVVLAFVARQVIGPVSLQVGGGEKGGVVIGTQGIELRPGKKAWPPNTDAELFVAATLEPAASPGTPARLLLDFTQGKEELNAWSGTWRLVDGQLQVLQGGNETSRARLVPRAYVAHRYFSSDDFSAEVQMDVRPLGKAYPDESDAQHFGELAFRIRDLQVSIFAIPEVGMRLAWRYTSKDGEEVVGNSAQDIENLNEDETPVPAKRPFRVRLQLKRVKNAVEVVAFVNGQRFARKVLPGLEGRVGKLALGCRNLACTFDELQMRGILTERPKSRRVAGAQE